MPIAPSLRIGRRHRHALERGRAGPVRVPHRQRDVPALEERDDLVRLRVHHLDVRLQPLDRLEARIDVLHRAAVDARRRHQELLARGARDVRDGQLALPLRLPEVGPRRRRRLHQVRVVGDDGAGEHHGDPVGVLVPRRLVEIVPVLDLRGLERLEQPFRLRLLDDLAVHVRDVELGARAGRPQLRHGLHGAAEHVLHGGAGRLLERGRRGTSSSCPRRCRRRSPRSARRRTRARPTPRSAGISARSFAKRSWSVAPPGARGGAIIRQPRRASQPGPHGLKIFAPTASSTRASRTRKKLTP